MRFKKYLLTEKTYRIGADVDLIYKKTFAKYEKIFKKGDFRKFIKAVQSADNVGNGKFGFGVIKSSELKSRDCRIAHDLNPIKIQCGLLGGNFYKPKTKTIQVSLNSNAVNLIILQKAKSIDDILSILGSSNQIERFNSEFDAKSLKGSIYHELSHWINDSIHNFHITKMLKKASELDKISILQRDGSNLFTDYEIDAQVHAIKQLKREFNKSWDLLSWQDIIQIKPSFIVIKQQLKRSTPKVQKDYHKRMIKRSNREQLLGKLMQKTFIKDMIQ